MSRAIMNEQSRQMQAGIAGGGNSPARIAPAAARQQAPQDGKSAPGSGSPAPFPRNRLPAFFVASTARPRL